VTEVWVATVGKGQAVTKSTRPIGRKKKPGSIPTESDLLQAFGCPRSGRFGALNLPVRAGAVSSGGHSLLAGSRLSERFEKDQRRDKHA
jgi:hypothetical protein